MARLSFRLIVTALLLIPGAAAAQTPPPPPPAGSQAATLPVAPLPARPDVNSYEVGPEDTLKIEIYGEDRLTKEFKVGPDGMITFPYIGDIKAAGLSVRQLVSEITRRLVEGKFLIAPQVVADVVSYRSQLVMVQGQVNNPGDIMLSGSEMTLTRALSRAQISPLAASYIEIYRRKPGADPLAAGPENFELIRVERKALDSFQEDPRLVHGDRVFVPKAPIFFINGHVKAGGTQVWVPGMTVGKAIAAAGGLSERGTQRGLKIKRMVNGVFKEFKADVNTVVQPEDQIIVAQRRF